MRTIEETEKDIENTTSARRSMANVSDAEPEGRAIFLENCDRELARLREERRETINARNLATPYSR